MSRYAISVPSFAANLTADLVAPYLSEQHATYLKSYSGQVLSLIWVRLRKDVRLAIEKWWENV